MSEGRAATGPSALAATQILARWSALRMVRGRTVWLAAIFALLPVGFAAALTHAGSGATWRELFVPLVMLVGVLAPLFMASSLAEEIEDRTFTYLWSRPVPRWTVVVGKLLAAAPISGAILAASVTACFAVAGGGDPDQLGRAIASVLVGAVSVSGISAGLAILLPRAGLGATYAYLLALDLPVGAIPFSLRNLSVTHQMRQVAGVSDTGDPLAVALLWLLAIGAFWLAIAIWRLSRAEFSSGER